MLSRLTDVETSKDEFKMHSITSVDTTWWQVGRVSRWPSARGCGCGLDTRLARERRVDVSGGELTFLAASVFTALAVFQHAGSESHNLSARWQ